MYRSIETSLWSDPKVKSLPADGRLLFLYLITNAHAHVSGIYILEAYLIAHETGLTPKRIDTLWDALANTPGGPLVLRDRGVEVVWVVNMLTYQGRGEKIILGVNTHLKGLHHSFLIGPYVEKYSHLGVVFEDTLSDTLLVGYSIPTVTVTDPVAVSGKKKSHTLKWITDAHTPRGEECLVFLSEEEEEKVLAAVGRAGLDWMILKLEGYIHDHRKYQPHHCNLMLKGWLAEKWEEYKAKNGRGAQAKQASPEDEAFDKFIAEAKRLEEEGRVHTD